jgi:carboxyl-terminal processing protease
MKNFKLFLIITSAVFFGFVSALSYSQISIKQIKFDDNKITKKDKDFIDQVIKRVKSDYVEEKSDDQLAEFAASGILSALDPHSSYLNDEALKEINVQTKGEFGGLGIEITQEATITRVISAIEDTPAFKAGVKSGDYIVKINDKNAVGLSIEEVVKKLRGKPGTSVKISILRKGEKEPLIKNITRQVIKVKAVKSAQFKDIAYIKINTFSEQAMMGLENELNKLKQKIGEKNLKGLVLDLRNNPGGLLDQAVKISDAFLSKDSLIVSIKGRNVDEREYRDSNNETLIPKLPIVVLINEGSASASEIVAGALQDHNRAIIMGTKSFGKGSVQSIIPLGDKQGALRLTTSLYYTPSGKSIQAQGIEPNIVLSNAKIEKQTDKFDKDSEADLKGHIEVQLQKAIEESKRDQVNDDNLEIYSQDYQLARAIDLIRGVSLYNNKLNK